MTPRQKRSAFATRWKVIHAALDRTSRPALAAVVGQLMYTFSKDGDINGGDLVDEVAFLLERNDLLPFHDAKLADAARREAARAAEVRSVEYWRCWPDGTWDTAAIDVPAGTPVDRMDGVILRAVQDLVLDGKWTGDRPAFVGLYHAPQPEE